MEEPAAQIASEADRISMRNRELRAEPAFHARGRHRPISRRARPMPRPPAARDASSVKTTSNNKTEPNMKTKQHHYQIHRPTLRSHCWRPASSLAVAAFARERGCGAGFAETAEVRVRRGEHGGRASRTRARAEDRRAAAAPREHSREGVAGNGRRRAGEPARTNVRDKRDRRSIAPRHARGSRAASRSSMSAWRPRP